MVVRNGDWGQVVNCRGRVGCFLCFFDNIETISCFATYTEGL